MNSSADHIPSFKRKPRAPLAIACLSAALGILAFVALHLLFPLPDKIEYSTIITDNKGETIHAFLTKDDKWRMKTALDEISPLLSTTIIQKEDRFFYYHYGVNPLALIKAAAKNLFQGRRASGASTITMQVARALEPKPRSYTGKLVEIFRAWQLEWKYSKEDILQMYCNLLPYGGNIEGVKSASLLYFKKDPDHLSLAEIVALCVIPNRPSSLVPGKNNQEIERQRNRWLQKFADEKVFTRQEIQDALTEPFDASRNAAPKLVPHLAYKLKRSFDGPVIESAIDMNIQLKTEKLASDYARGLQLKNIRHTAVVVIDNQSKKIIAYTGSADFTDTIDGGQVNGAAAIRQPGSLLKPLAYGKCIDKGLFTPRSVINDVGINYDGYAPENFDKQFNGYVTLQYALEHSLNIPAVKSLALLGKDELISSLAFCNFQQIRKDQRKLGLSMILGGCGATLEELTGLYTAFASEGLYARPGFLNAPSADRPYRVMSPAATFMINEILTKVNRPDFPLNWQSTEHMPQIAWKTGTSYGRRDAWSIGYNKRFTVGVWAGNFSGKGVPELSGADIATPLLFRIFNAIDYDSDREWFSQPPDCDIRQVCSETGLPPGEHCHNLATDYFIPLESSARACNHMQEIMVSADEKIAYCRSCLPHAGYKKKLFRTMAPEMQQYFDERGISYQKIPAHNPDCERIFRDGQPAILSPRNGSEYLISRKNPEPLQLKCRPGSDAEKIYWHINNRFYKVSQPNDVQFFIPEEGPVKISCTDDKGRNKDIWIRIRYVDL
ncbi:MAG TPA: penicillin-binding protein 1C [Flavitalea sp.]|nr:penicillin-binding protein 1C [Flavitalea sp.]